MYCWGGAYPQWTCSPIHGLFSCFHGLLSPLSYFYLPFIVSLLYVFKCIYFIYQFWYWARPLAWKRSFFPHSPFCDRHCFFSRIPGKLRLPHFIIKLFIAKKGYDASSPLWVSRLTPTTSFITLSLFWGVTPFAVDKFVLMNVLNQEYLEFPILFSVLTSPLMVTIHVYRVRLS